MGRNQRRQSILPHKRTDALMASRLLLIKYSILGEVHEGALIKVVPTEMKKDKHYGNQTVL